MATRVSLAAFLSFTRPTAVFTSIVSPSRSTHTGETCGEPSGMRVARKAKFLPSISLMALASSFAGNNVTVRHSRSQKCKGCSISRKTAKVGSIPGPLGLDRLLGQSRRGAASSASSNASSEAFGAVTVLLPSALPQCSAQYSLQITMTP